jgi:nucleotide-binding universal stress UspA family protein
VASQLGRQLGLRLVVAHVVQTPIATSWAATFAAPSPREPLLTDLDAGGRLLDHVLTAEGLEHAERRIVVGFPPDRLADLADQEDADLVVVGSRGRGAFKAAFLGSVSTGLVGVARVPVLVVPPGAAGAAIALGAAPASDGAGAP